MDKLELIEILHKLFGQITTTLEIAKEFGKPLPSWFNIQTVVNKDYQFELEKSLDDGEASAIALAVESYASLLIIDDKKGRRVAEKLGLTTTGTIGIIVNAKLAGIVPSVKPILKKIRATNFRLSREVEMVILERAGEI